MRSGTIALLLGILCVQRLPALADECFVQFLPLALFIGIFCRFLRLPALFLCGLLWATFRAHLAVAEILPAHLDGAEMVADGRIVGVPLMSGGRARFEFEVESLGHAVNASAPVELPQPARFTGRVRLSWYGAPELRAGEHWRLRLRLRAPRGYLNPGGFDYERWLFARGIRATGYVRAKGEARRLHPGHPVHLHRWRQQVAERIIDYLPERRLAGVIAALSVGVRGHIGEDQWRVFRDTGTAHLMAISGLHVGLVSALAFVLARLVWSRCYHLCLWVPAQRAAAVAGLAAGVSYSAMAGFSLPTQRAMIMLGVVMWCLSCNRTTAFSVVLCAALAAVILIDPFSVLGPSLWLSFTAVAVLAFGMSNRQGAGDRGLRRIWWRWGRAQCLAALGLAPVLLAVFGQQPLLSPLANLLAIPWTACLVVPGAIAGAALVFVWPSAGAWTLETTAALLELLWPALAWLASAEYTLKVFHSPSSFTLAAAAVGVVILLSPKELPARWLGVLWMAPLVGLTSPAPPPGALWLTLLDVGHGLAVVARTRHHVLVFDTGPRYTGGFDAGSGVVAPFLRSHGIHFVDTVVISHPDNDHSGGLDGLLAAVSTGSIIGATDKASSGACVGGTGWDWDGYRFRLLHPRKIPRFRGNDASCVLRISGPGGSVLIAADIEAQAEARLVARFGEGLAANILVAPHHGSRSSSTAAFVNAVRPDYALFSASQRRRPHLPEKGVVARYLALGARPLNTGQAGAVSVELRPGVPPRVSAYRSRVARYWRPSATGAAWPEASP
ncbi:MAG TPA: DNA internalization-related competence protein ComEC/Rec2 [Gammaproteobacteria bacterium]|nr:DNA internalization-related competence protein ComEC/Rec2 [Gammaproteobacteria bacterium]